MVPAHDLSLNAWAVLCLLADDGPQHGFALAKQLGRTTEVGRVWAVSRPLVYRALEQLEQRGLVTAEPEVPSPSGPQRQAFRATGAGRRLAREWRAEPVARFRDVRPTLILKLTLARRAGHDIGPLLAAQRQVLGPQLDEVRRRGAVAVAGADGGDPTVVVDVWRQELGEAIERTLVRLQGLAPGAEREGGQRG